MIIRAPESEVEGNHYGADHSMPPPRHYLRQPPDISHETWSLLSSLGLSKGLLPRIFRSGKQYEVGNVLEATDVRL